MKRIIFIIFPVIFIFSACALEIANVIGPGGGYVYYDKGNYKDGWRYKECSPFDLGELKDISNESLKRAMRLCVAQSDEWYAYDWEMPDEADLKKILECFSYGLTRFSPDYYYLSIDTPTVDIPVLDYTKPRFDSDGNVILDEDGNITYESLPDYEKPIFDKDGKPMLDKDGNLTYKEKIEHIEYKINDEKTWKPDTWDKFILHKNFDNKLNGEVEEVEFNKIPSGNVIRVRPIRKF